MPSITHLDSWLPAAERAAMQDTLACIAEDLSQPAGVASPNPSMTRGSAGLSLFFFELYRLTSEERWLVASERHLDQAADHFREAEPNLSLFQGHTGLGWMMVHFNVGLGLGDDDEMTPLDELAVAALHSSRGPIPFELARGAVGVGVYGLKRSGPAPRRRITERVLDNLRQTFHRGHGRPSWWSDPADFPEPKRGLYPTGAWDLGLPHGVAGVLSYLATVLEAPTMDEALRDEAAGLLDASLDWLEDRVLPELNRERPGKPVDGVAILHPSHVAWCYGELALGLGLLRAGWARSRRSSIAQGLSRCRNAAATALWEAERDAKLCHGSAGNAHLFHRLFRATQEPLFRDAALAAFGRTLEQVQPGRGMGGLAFLQSSRVDDAQGEWERVPGILEGSAGVGLALISALSPKPPTWDAWLLTELPWASRD